MKRTFVSGALFCLVLSQSADLALPARADVPPGESDLIEPMVGPVPAAAGTGLSGAYWHMPPDSIDNLANRGGNKDIGLDVMNTLPPQATFMATRIDYSGNDLTPVGQWLGADGPSLAPPDAGNLDDGLIRLTGFLAIHEAGLKTFTCASDDGALVWIGNRLVIDNDGTHGAPGDGAEGTAFFSEAGLYPIEIAWFNSDWIDDVGGHGGASLQFTCNGAAIPTADLYPDEAAGLRIRMANSAVVVEWVGEDQLQCASTALGPWTDVSDALGSYTTPPR